MLGRAICSSRKLVIVGSSRNPNPCVSAYMSAPIINSPVRTIMFDKHLKLLAEKIRNAMDIENKIDV